MQDPRTLTGLSGLPQEFGKVSSDGQLTEIVICGSKKFLNAALL